MEQLINNLKKKGVLKSKFIENALLFVDRVNFVPKDLLNLVYSDEPLHIGYGQTMSQPYTIVFMLELLCIKKGNQIMEAGYGSGWQTIILSYLIGDKGKVYAFEIIKELCQFGKNNINKYPELARRIFLFCKSANTKLSSVKINSLDRIIVCADIKNIPKDWKDKLVVGGIIVYPNKNSIYKEIKNSDETFTKEEFYGFSFVPFV